VVATLISHSFWTLPAEAQSAQQTQFFKNVAIIGGLLFYFVSGPGACRVPVRFHQRWGSPKDVRPQMSRSRA
jgi:putative oxidoreductase